MPTNSKKRSRDPPNKRPKKPNPTKPPNIEPPGLPSHAYYASICRTTSTRQNSISGSPLPPEWTHATTTLMHHPLSSDPGKHIKKWILYLESINTPCLLSNGIQRSLKLIYTFKCIKKLMELLPTSRATQSGNLLAL